VHAIRGISLDEAKASRGHERCDYCGIRLRRDRFEAVEPCQERPWAELFDLLVASISRADCALA